MFILMLSAGNIAIADHEVPFGFRSSNQSSSQRGLTEQQVIRNIQQRYPGKVLSITLQKRRQQSVYRIKLLHRGRIKVLWVDAMTGEVR